MPRTKNPPLYPCPISDRMHGMNGRMTLLCGMVLLVAQAACPAIVNDPVLRVVTDASTHATAEKRALEHLSFVVPQENSPATATRMVHKQHVTWGELFERGRTHAVVELQQEIQTTPSMIALASWNVWQWKVDQVIELPVYRKGAGMAPLGEKFKLGKEDEKVFQTFQFHPSMPPALMVTTLRVPYHRNYSLLFYDPGTRQLRLPALFVFHTPTCQEGYWKLTMEYRHKVCKVVESYYELDEGELVFRGSLCSCPLGGSLYVEVTFPGADGGAPPHMGARDQNGKPLHVCHP